MKEHEPRQREVQIRFYEELNDFLAHDQRRRSFVHRFTGTPAVKDVVESLGVPHTEIDLILVGDEPVAFSHRIEGGERIAVFPVFERFDITTANRLRPRPLRRTRFVLDVHLGKLARLLRLAGLDCYYRNDLEDVEIIAISTAQKRVILSRDLGLLKNGRVTHGYWVRATDAPAQLREVVESFDLRASLQPFTRCMDCNGRLRSADDNEVMELVPPAVVLSCDGFWQCADCRKIYWKGSHYEQLKRVIDAI